MARIPVGQSNANLNVEPTKAQRNANASAMGGSMFAELGKGLGDIAEGLERAHSLAEQTKAENYAQLKLSELNLRRSQDPDLSSDSQKKYLDEADSIVSQAGEMISQPYSRDLFISEGTRLSGMAKISMKKDFMEKVVSNARANMSTYFDAQYKDYVGTKPEDQKSRETAILRRDRKLDQMQEAGFITPAERQKMSVDLARQWHEGYAETQMYRDPERFMSDAAQGFYKDLDSKKIEGLMSDAERLKEKYKKERQKQEAEVYSAGESNFLKAVIDGGDDKQLVSLLDSYYRHPQGKQIGDEFYKLAKVSILNDNAKESDPKTVVGLMMDYSRISQAEDETKAKRAFRSEILLKKSELSEDDYKMLLSWSDDKLIFEKKKEAGGLWRFLSSALSGAGVLGAASSKEAQKLVAKTADNILKEDVFKDLPPLAAMRIMDTAARYMKGEYKVGQIVSRGGRQFEIVKQDDGSIGFLEK